MEAILKQVMEELRKLAANVDWPGLLLDGEFYVAVKKLYDVFQKHQKKPTA